MYNNRDLRFVLVNLRTKNTVSTKTCVLSL